MILKNNALQELYDALASGTMTISPYAESPVEKAFRECDDKLQKDIDIWRRSNDFLRSANTDLINENRKLKQDHESDVRTIGKLHSQMVNLEDEKTEREKRADILKSQRDMIKKALDELKRDNKLLTESRDEWSKRAIENRKQIVELEKAVTDQNELEEKNALLDAQFKDLEQRYDTTMLSYRIVKERLDKSIADRKALQADRDIWFRKNGEKQAEIEELKKKIESLTTDLEFKELCRDGWRDRAEQAERQLEEKKKQSYADGYSEGNEEGQNELWEMLQLINDVKPFEAPYFEDVTSMNDIISWDLEDFKEAYSKWEEEKKNVEHMRSYLKRYCIGKSCFGCPLYNTSEPVSSCMFSELTDKEVEERYRKAVDSEYKKTRVPVSARLPQPWECTIEAKVEINKDLLEKVCGVKSDEEAPHRLEYGDAVRLPWRDYDYMYIGPEEKHIRLFNPKTHTVVFVAPNENLKYQGCKIVITDEEDLRKIWKYKK